ncbi:MAG: alpha/beta fold hydrolase [Azospirillaceae bacterium]
MTDDTPRPGLACVPEPGPAPEPRPFTVEAADGFPIRGFCWRHETPDRDRPVVIITAATSVRCRYYFRFAGFLYHQGFDAVVYDYRGIGESRPPRLAGFRGSWLDWGRLDFDAALVWTARQFPARPIHVVAHSVGGFVIGLAPSNHLISRIFTMGAQIAHWRDYAPRARLGMVAKWHVAMPLLTELFGYFPGGRLGWMEDTPRGVVRDWGWSRPRLEDTCRRGYLAVDLPDRRILIDQFRHVTAPILAVGVSDDPFGTVPAVERLLAYFEAAPATHLRLTPDDVGEPSIGHFAFFHKRLAPALWALPLTWLRTGALPERVPGTIVADGLRRREDPGAAAGATTSPMPIAHAKGGQ